MRNCIQDTGAAQAAAARDANRARHQAALSLPHGETNQEKIMPRITRNHSARPTWRLTIAAFVPLIVIALLVLLAGCDTASTAAGTPPTNTAVPPTAIATTASSTPATSNAVAVEDFDFSPSALTVKAGTTVTWTNTSGGTSH